MVVACQVDQVQLPNRQDIFAAVCVLFGVNRHRENDIGLARVVHLRGGTFTAIHFYGWSLVGRLCNQKYFHI